MNRIQQLLLLLLLIKQLSHRSFVNSQREVIYKFSELRKAENDVGDGTKKYIALTFDDGPHQLLTPKLLDIAKAKGAIFTFYMMGIIMLNIICQSCNHVIM